MKSKFLKLFTVAMVSVMAVSGILVGCGRPTPPVETPGSYSTDENLTLNMAVMYDNSSYMTFKLNTEGDYRKITKEMSVEHAEKVGYLAANGEFYERGVAKIKPVWQELSNKLNFKINDLSYQGLYKDVAAQWTELISGTKLDNADMITATAKNITTYGVTDGMFEDLSKHLDKMPNFKKFLDNNSVVRKSILSNNDAIYYAPYFDGYDDLERMMMLRVDWVEKLLDSNATLDTAATVSTVYSKFMPSALNQKFTVVKADGSGTQEVTKNYAKNIIDIQNDLATKNGKNLVEALRSYIDSTYGSAFAKRSELFCGVNAAYDADELVALLRCVKANPQLLTGQSDSGKVVPFYPRDYTADRTADVTRFAEIFGVRGLDGRNGFLFIDENGELQDARFQENTWNGLSRLNALYKEGLILKDYNKSGAVSGSAFTGDNTYRGMLNKQNYGFMTYDYNQTSTVVNALGDGATPEIAGFNFTPVLPPFTDWGYKTSTNAVEYTRFTDSWRSVKSDGWAILASAPKARKERAIVLMDYLFSEEGAKLMSYGPSDWIDGTIDYNGKKVPKLSQKALDELQFYTGGNYTNYYRRYLGGTFPVGYVKEQGMEYQTVHAKGRVGLDNILRAIELGTVSHLVVNTEGVTDSRLYTVPTTLPYTKVQEDVITNQCADLQNTWFNVNKSNTEGNAFISAITVGFGAKIAEKNYDFTTVEAFVNQIKGDKKGDLFMTHTRNAYAKYLAKK